MEVIKFVTKPASWTWLFRVGKGAVQADLDLLHFSIGGGAVYRDDYKWIMFNLGFLTITYFIDYEWEEWEKYNDKKCI